MIKSVIPCVEPGDTEERD